MAHLQKMSKVSEVYLYAGGLFAGELENELCVHNIEFKIVEDADLSMVTNDDILMVPVEIESTDDYCKPFKFKMYNNLKANYQEPTLIFVDLDHVNIDTGYTGVAVADYISNSSEGDMIATGYQDFDSTLTELEELQSKTDKSTKEVDDEYLYTLEGKYIFLVNGHDGLTQGTTYRIDYIGDLEFIMFDDNGHTFTMSFDFLQRNFKRFVVPKENVLKTIDLTTFGSLYKAIIINKYL